MDIQLSLSDSEADVTCCFADVSADFLTTGTEYGARSFIIFVLNFDVFSVSDELIVEVPNNIWDWCAGKHGLENHFLTLAYSGVPYLLHERRYGLAGCKEYEL